MKAATKTRAGPKRTTPGLRISGAVTNVRLRAEYHRDRLMQACITSWFKEAERLAGEYLHTGRTLHLEAFIRHVEGMFAAIQRRISRIADKLENIGITV